jgi:hypothetical protein
VLSNNLFTWLVYRITDMSFKIKINILLFALSSIAPDQDNQSPLTKDTNTTSHESLAPEPVIDVKTDSNQSPLTKDTNTTSHESLAPGSVIDAKTDNNQSPLAKEDSNTTSHASLAPETVIDAKPDSNDTHTLTTRAPAKLPQSASAQSFLRQSTKANLTAADPDSSDAGVNNQQTRSPANSNSSFRRQTIRGRSDRLHDSDGISSDDRARQRNADIEMTPPMASNSFAGADSHAPGDIVVRSAMKGRSGVVTVRSESIDPLAPTSPVREGRRNAAEINPEDTARLSVAFQDYVHTPRSSGTSTPRSFSHERRGTLINTERAVAEIRDAVEEYRRQEGIDALKKVTIHNTKRIMCCRLVVAAASITVAVLGGAEAYKNKEEIVQTLKLRNCNTFQRVGSVIYSEKLIHQKIQGILNQNTTDHAKLQLISDLSKSWSNNTLTVTEVANNMLDEAIYIAQETDKLTASRVSDSHLSQTVIS